MNDTTSDRDALAEEGRRLASEREDLISRGVDPATLDVPLHPGGGAELSRETLAAWWESFDGPAYPTGEQFSEAFLASDWLAAHDRDLLGQAHAPIKAVMERYIDLDADDEPDFEPGEPTWRFVRDLIAALDLAAVAEYERAVGQRYLRDAADDLPTMAGWHDVEMDTIRLAQKRIRDRADALGGDDR